MQGIRLELCTNDRVGLLSDVTRIFREHGLSVARADVSTRDKKALNVFYVTDASGMAVDSKVLEAVRREISEIPLCPMLTSSNAQQTKSRFSLGNIFGKPSLVLYSLGLIKSYS
mgnify:CR=1 FL=1